MGRRERTIQPTDGQVARFALELRKLRDTAGRPTYRELAKRTSYSVSALADAAGGKRLPTLAVTLAFVEACGGDRVAWTARWRALAAELHNSNLTGKKANSTPYVGLATFQENDRHRFFGREQLVAELADRALSARLLALSGPSGSGKSSVISAGLLPTLKRRKPSVQTIVISPGRRPSALLAHALGLSASPFDDPPGALADRLIDRHPPARRLMVVVDQFEELFTFCHDEQERAMFITSLLTVNDMPDTGVHLLLSVRADFLAQSAGHPDLVAALRDRTIPIGPIDLRSAIVKPAASAGVKVEDALIERIISDSADEPGSVPLVSHALEQIWKRRNGRGILTLATYLDLGDLRGVAAQLGESAYNQLDTEQRDLMIDLFIRLTTTDEVTGHARRQVPHDELLTGQSGAVVSVVEHLVKSRLITIEESGVTVANDAVIHGWPRLQTWLTENRLRDLERAVVTTNDRTIHLHWLLVSVLAALVVITAVVVLLLTVS